MEVTITNLRENESPSLHRWCNDSRNKSPSLHKRQCLEPWNPEKENKRRETINFNADAANTDLLFRIIDSVSQLSIYGAVSNWWEVFGPRPHQRGPTSEKFAKEMNKDILESVISQEVNSLGKCSMDATSIGQPMARKSSEL